MKRSFEQSQLQLKETGKVKQFQHIYFDKLSEQFVSSEYAPKNSSFTRSSVSHNLQTFAVKFDDFSFYGPNKRLLSAHLSKGFSIDCSSVKQYLVVLSPNAYLAAGKIILISSVDEDRFEPVNNPVELIAEARNTQARSVKLIRNKDGLFDDVKAVNDALQNLLGTCKKLTSEVFNLPTDLASFIANNPKNTLSLFLCFQSPNKHHHRRESLLADEPDFENPKSTFNNLQITCEHEEKIFANCTTICSSSAFVYSVIEKMLIKESWGYAGHVDQALRVIKFPSLTKFAVLTIVKYCYEKTFQPMQFSQLECMQIFKAAIEFGLYDITTPLLDRFKYLSISGDDSVLDLLVFSQDNNLGPLQDNCLATIKIFEHDLRRSEKWEKLTERRISFLTKYKRVADHAGFLRI